MDEAIGPWQQHPALVLAQLLRSRGDVVTDEQVAQWQAICDEPADLPLGQQLLALDDPSSVERWIRADLVERLRESVENNPWLVRGNGRGSFNP